MDSLIHLLVACQVVFLMWHLYCVCFNIRTDEWVNWKRYPEFQLTIHKQELGKKEICNKEIMNR